MSRVYQSCIVSPFSTTKGTKGLKGSERLHMLLAARGTFIHSSSRSQIFVPTRLRTSIRTSFRGPRRCERQRETLERRRGLSWCLCSSLARVLITARVSISHPHTHFVDAGEKGLPVLHPLFFSAWETRYLWGSNRETSEGGMSATTGAPPVGSAKTPADFLKSIRGRPVVVKLNSGVDYRGILLVLGACDLIRVSALSGSSTWKESWRERVAVAESCVYPSSLAASSSGRWARG